MPTNLDRYKNDLDDLIAEGQQLANAIQAEHYPKEVKQALKQQLGASADIEKILAELPRFRERYQAWYSEAKALVKQLLPDRLEDFVRHYETPKSRKSLSFESYRIADCLQGLTNRNWDNEITVGPGAAIPHVQQQLAILTSAKARFESSLFDIRQLVQADLFDSEIDAARELLKKGFGRAAGAVVGVVLEGHLRQVCENHNVKPGKQNPTISTFNDALKNAGVLDTPTWRSIQHLGDLRNLCDHDKKQEPTREQIQDLIDGVAKVTKTLF